eukprot:scaffold116596_cov30-Tisochrysis_lutea.AAC.1
MPRIQDEGREQRPEPRRAVTIHAGLQESVALYHGAHQDYCRGVLRTHHQTFVTAWRPRALLAARPSPTRACAHLNGAAGGALTAFLHHGSRARSVLLAGPPRLRPRHAPRAEKGNAPHDRYKASDATMLACEETVERPHCGARARRLMHNQLASVVVISCSENDIPNDRLAAHETGELDGLVTPGCRRPRLAEEARVHTGHAKGLGYRVDVVGARRQLDVTGWSLHRKQQHQQAAWRLAPLAMRLLIGRRERHGRRHAPADGCAMPAELEAGRLLDGMLKRAQLCMHGLLRREVGPHVAIVAQFEKRQLPSVSLEVRGHVCPAVRKQAHQRSSKALCDQSGRQAPRLHSPSDWVSARAEADGTVSASPRSLPSLPALLWPSPTFLPSPTPLVPALYPSAENRPELRPVRFSDSMCTVRGGGGAVGGDGGRWRTTKGGGCGREAGRGQAEGGCGGGLEQRGAPVGGHTRTLGSRGLPKTSAFEASGGQGKGQTCGSGVSRGVRREASMTAFSPV